MNAFDIFYRIGQHLGGAAHGMEINTPVTVASLTRGFAHPALADNYRQAMLLDDRGHVWLCTDGSGRPGGPHTPLAIFTDHYRSAMINGPVLQGDWRVPAFRQKFVQTVTASKNPPGQEHSLANFQPADGCTGKWICQLLEHF